MLPWKTNSTLHASAPLMGEFYVEIRKGSEMVKLSLKHEYNHARFYAVLWSYNPEKGRMVRRELGNHVTMRKAQKIADDYLSNPKVMEEMTSRLEYHNAVLAGTAPAIRPAPSCQSVMVDGYDVGRLMDLDD